MMVQRVLIPPVKTADFHTSAQPAVGIEAGSGACVAYSKLLYALNALKFDIRTALTVLKPPLSLTESR
jgi:hypothetical protein